MIIEQRILDFEKLGFGMFVHFGLYSILGKGEWAKRILHVPDEEYEPMAKEFNPKKDWAENLVATAKKAGCRYITLTTRHHDGYSLYDTKGLNDYDAPHSCGRDLVKEFVDACREADIIPFFYHTLLDWREKSYEENFPEYLKYLRESVKLLCTNYGEIGGIWFDGKWNKKEADWEEDALYGMIRQYQPNAMIINNTGVNCRGELGHIELDSVTFEQGRPTALNMEGAPKYIASEMCETMAGLWGYGFYDLSYKNPERLIKDLCVCRRNRANLLLNIGPKGDGSLRPLDTEIFECVGTWVSYYDEALHDAMPTDIVIENKPDNFILKDGKNYYLFCVDIGMGGDGNVVVWSGDKDKLCKFDFSEKIKNVTWLEDGSEVKYSQENGKVELLAAPFKYGTNLIVRIAKIETE
jgi:alpha-L-fucosidase